MKQEEKIKPILKYNEMENLPMIDSEKLDKIISTSLDKSFSSNMLSYRQRIGITMNERTYKNAYSQS